jgi:hypothetical protein
VVHIEPYQQTVAAPEGQILNDLINFFHRGTVVEIQEMGGKIHAPQGLFRSEINGIFHRSKTILEAWEMLSRCGRGLQKSRK